MGKKFEGVVSELNDMGWNVPLLQCTNALLLS